MARVILDDVSVSFPVFDAKATSLRANLIYLGSGGALGQDPRGHVTIAALSGVSLRVETGDRVAVIGRNGSGKSTLLKVIAGIYRPTQGSVTVEGRISAVLGTGLVVDDELTGWEAIEYACLLRGVRRERLEELGKDVAEFTELGNYLSVPVRTYSAGMKMRLRFAVATCDAPDVLLIDEAIGAGDIYFLEKARHRARHFLEQSNIVFLASHSEDVLQSICTKAVVLDRGEIVAAGPIRGALQAYHGLGGPPRNRVTVSALEFAADASAEAGAPAGRPFASRSGRAHPPEHAFDGNARTYWLSDPAAPVRGRAFLGFDFGPGQAIEVRRVSLRQRAHSLDSAGCVTRVAVQASDDGFGVDVRTAETMEVEPDASTQTVTVPPIGPARSWRLLALSDAVADGAWGLVEVDFDSMPAERLDGGRAIGSEPVAMHFPVASAFDGSPFTRWTARERAEAVRGVSWIGYDFGAGRELEVRSFTIRQWEGGGRPNTIPVVKVQLSGDGFVNDVRTADTVKIAQDTEPGSYDVAPSARARFWRLLADAPTDGGHWGVVELRFSQYPARRRRAAATRDAGEPSR